MPVPSSDKLIATTTISASVMVRFRRRPIQTSDRTNCERILAPPSAAATSPQTYRIEARPAGERRPPVSTGGSMAQPAPSEGVDGATRPQQAGATGLLAGGPGGARLWW